MAARENLQPNAVLRGILPDALVTVVSVQRFGSQGLELTCKTPSGKVANELLYRHDEPRLEKRRHGRQIGRRSSEVVRYVGQVREDGSRPSVNIVKDADAGRLRLLECRQEDLRSTFELFDLPTQQSVDPGELHALTAIRMSPDEEKPRFCCADRVAVVCLCLLGFSSLAVALEALLTEVGLSRSLHSRFSRSALAARVREGKERRLRGQGLATAVPG